MPLAFPAVTLPALSKAARSAASEFAVVWGRGMLVDLDVHRLLPLLHRDGDDLVREAPALHGDARLALRLRGERVLVGAAHLEVRGHVLGGDPHVAVVEGAPEPVADHHVDELPVAEAVAVAPVLEQVGRPAHVLHAAGDDHLGVAEPDRLGGEGDGLQPRAAHLVHGHRRDPGRQARAHRRLPGRVLPEAGLEDVPHQDLLDRLRVDAGAADRLLDGDAPECGRGQVDEDTAHGADGGAHRTDDDRVFHGSLTPELGWPTHCSAGIAPGDVSRRAAGRTRTCSARRRPRR